MDLVKSKNTQLQRKNLNCTYPNFKWKFYHLLRIHDKNTKENHNHVESLNALKYAYFSPQIFIA